MHTTFKPSLWFHSDIEIMFLSPYAGWNHWLTLLEWLQFKCGGITDNVIVENPFVFISISSALWATMKYIQHDNTRTMVFYIQHRAGLFHFTECFDFIAVVRRLKWKRNGLSACMVWHWYAQYFGSEMNHLFIYFIYTCIMMAVAMVIMASAIWLNIYIHYL